MNRAPIQIVLDHVRAVADTGSPDDQLLERFAVLGEEMAFSILLRRHGALVWSVCRRILLHSHDAEDAFQATFLVLARKSGTVRKQSSIGAWLHGVASRLSWQLRKRIASQTLEPIEDLPGSGQPEPHEEISLREALTILDEEIGRLPEKHRGPIVSCHLEGKTTEEAARELGAPVGTVRTRLLRARELLQARLRNRGITAPAGVVMALAAVEASGAVLPRALAPRTLGAVLSFVSRGSANPAKAVQLANGFLMSQMTHRLVWWAAGLAAAVLLGGGATAFLAAGPEAPGAEPEAFQVVEKGEPDLKVAKAARAHADPLPLGPVVRPEITHVRPGAQADCISISPNGQLLAAAEEGGNVWLWEVSTGREVAVLRKAHPRIQGAVFSPNCQTVAVVNNRNEISLWDVASGKETRRWKTPGHHLVAFAPDGKTLASAGVSRVFCFWDSSTGKLVRRMEAEHRACRSQLQFSADGKFIAASDCGEVVVLETATGNKWLGIDVRTQGPTDGLTFAPGGKMLAASCASGRRVGVFGTVPDRSKKAPPAEGWPPFPTAKKLHELESPPGHRAAAIAFSPDGRVLAVGSGEGMVHLWDTATWRHLGAMRGHKGDVTALGFLSNARFAWASANETELAWEVAAVPIASP